jgi:hypothetical protein
LFGTVTGHPIKKDGEKVQTSSIEKIFKGRKQVRTRSGSVYTLGKVDPEYVKWCEENGHMNPNDLFKDKRRKNSGRSKTR